MGFWFTVRFAIYALTGIICSVLLFMGMIPLTAFGVCILAAAVMYWLLMTEFRDARKKGRLPIKRKL
jgi:ABC-type cobalamin transport system permease subunit